jgi:hypothetical protein
LEQKAYFYVCGDAANMAREVNAALIKITAEQRGIPDAKAEEIVKSMRSANQYQVRRFCIPRLTHPIERYRSAFRTRLSKLAEGGGIWTSRSAFFLKFPTTSFPAKQASKY